MAWLFFSIILNKMVEFEPVLLFSLIFLSVPLQFYLSPKSSDIKYHLTKLVVFEEENYIKNVL